VTSGLFELFRLNIWKWKQLRDWDKLTGRHGSWGEDHLPCPQCFPQ